MLVAVRLIVTSLQKDRNVLVCLLRAKSRPTCLHYSQAFTSFIRLQKYAYAERTYVRITLTVGLIETLILVYFAEENVPRFSYKARKLQGNGSLINVQNS